MVGRDPEVGQPMVENIQGPDDELEESWKVTEDKDAKLAAFATAPAIRRSFANLFSEISGTFILVFGLMEFLFLMQKMVCHTRIKGFGIKMLYILKVDLLIIV